MFQSQEVFGIPIYVDHIEIKDSDQLDKLAHEHASNYVYKILQVNSSKHKLESSDSGLITAIVFLNQERNTNILLHKEWINIFPRDLNIEYLGLNSATADDWNFSPRRGDVVIFPSHLKYSISNKEDYQIFNFTLAI